MYKLQNQKEFNKYYTNVIQTKEKYIQHIFNESKSIIVEIMENTVIIQVNELNYFFTNMT